MDVRATLLAGLERLKEQHPTATDEAHAWLQRLEILLDWIAKHPSFVEIRSEAARLLLQYRGADAPAEHAPTLPERETPKSRKSH